MLLVTVIHTQVFETKLPEPLPTFEAMVQEGDEYPSVCVGVRQGWVWDLMIWMSSVANRENGGVKFEMINLNSRAILFESEQLGGWLYHCAMAWKLLVYLLHRVYPNIEYILVIITM